MREPGSEYGAQRRTLIGFEDHGAEPAAAAVPGDRVRLESARLVLPELDEAAVRARPWYRHPAFLVSASTTVMALIVMIVLLVVDPWGDKGSVTKVSGLRVVADEGAVTVVWDQPDQGTELYAFEPGDQVLADLSQLVRGTSAWLPVSAQLYSVRTCFLVRPATEAALPDPLDVQALEQQGAQVACVADAA